MSHPSSIVISRLLNDLGYSYELVLSSQNIFASKLLTSQFLDASRFKDSSQPNVIICGSKREGTSLLFENDFDGMLEAPFTECFESEEALQNSKAEVRFQLSRFENTAPGYALLKSGHNEDDSVNDSLVAIHGGHYLSSDDLKQYLIDTDNREVSEEDESGFVRRAIQGPSFPLQSLDGLINMDIVFAIRCECPNLLSQWTNRPRPYDWPSRELIDAVSLLQAHVVPVGNKGSPMQYIEWRICFTLGEIRLIESLNECQIKLIILLKLLANDELKPICQNMTSYIMKNLVLWLVESTPYSEFQEYNLIKHLINSLKVLKHCISKRNFPSYMIESRNLFAGRVTDVEVEQLCQKIDTLISEGPKMLLRCSKIRDGLAFFRSDPVTFSYLSKSRYFIMARLPEMIEGGIDQWVKYFKDNLLPDSESLKSKDFDESDINKICIVRCKYLLS